jgi:hypothetical protein
MDKRAYRMIFTTIIFIASLMISVHFPFLSIRPEDTGRTGSDLIQFTATVSAGELPRQPGLTIMPAEIDLGQLGPGGTRKGFISLKKTTSGSVTWSLAAPADWNVTDEKMMMGVLDKDSDLLQIQLKILNDEPVHNEENRKSARPAQLLFEAGEQASAFTRKIEPGHHHVRIRMETDSGPRAFDILFKLLDTTAQPLLGIDPLQIDFGTATQGEKVSRRVKVTNEGWETLKWRASVVRAIASDSGGDLDTGKYVSFLNHEIAGSGHYKVARHLKDGLELPDKWAENQGYPYASADGHTLRYHFTGTGIAVYFWKGPATGQLTAFVNDRFLFQQEGVSEQKERFKWQVAEGLSRGSHVLTLVNRNGPVAIEGLRIYGGETIPLNPGSIAISPDNGAVTRQTNYVNITVNTLLLSPGHYSGYILFDSNGGQKEIELSVDVMADNISRILNVYRYVRDQDYFLTTNPQVESPTLQARGYTNQGIAFRLFSPDMPGTTEFYRWFHPQKGDHFYGYELKSAKRPIQGYILEGSIGNIATSRLTHTRELYRWYNPSSRHYFYTVDPKGEGMQKKDYQYDGIAGYVRP